jgi:RNA polymerase sigma factor (sigma-70 family)
MPRDPARADDTATESLLRGLADDLDGGFADLVRANERVMFSVALRIGGTPVEAEDLVAESFLRAYRALRDYEPSRILALRPRPWLLTIMHNTWRNTLRSASRRPQQTLVADPPENTTENATADAGVEEQVESNETRRELAELLARLPPSQRVAVVLRHVVGLSIAETAMTLQIPEGTVKSHVSRGLRTLGELHGCHRTAREGSFDDRQRL